MKAPLVAFFAILMLACAAAQTQNQNQQTPASRQTTILIPGDFTTLITDSNQANAATYAEQMKTNPSSDVEAYAYDADGNSVRLNLLHLLGTYAQANLTAPPNFRPRKVMLSNNHLATYKIVTNVQGTADWALISYTPLPDEEVKARFGKRISSKFYAFDVQIQNLRSETLQASRAALKFDITYCLVKGKNQCDNANTLVKQRPPEDPTSVLAVFDNVTDRKKAFFDGAADVGKGASSVLSAFLTGNDLATQAATMFNSNAVPFASKFFVHEEKDKRLHDTVVSAAIKDNFSVAGGATETLTVFVAREPINGIGNAPMMVQTIGELHLDARWVQPVTADSVTGTSTQTSASSIPLKVPSSRNGD